MKNPLTLTGRLFAMSLLAAACASASMAQTPAPAGGAMVASEPGKAAIVQTVETSAQVVGIDKATRTLTLKGPKGQVETVVASDAVKNFDQIKLGDRIVARYAQALTLELKKTKGDPGAVVVREGAAGARPGEQPAGIGARQVTALVDVVGVDPKASTITVKGPTGNLTVLKVQNPDQFKVVKKGDQIEVTYTEALALSLEPAPKASPEKKK
jgi:ribosomal protein L6P/L9E